MATKRVQEVVIKIRVPLPLSYPLVAGATAHYTIDGLSEVDRRSVHFTGEVANGGITVTQILNAVKAGLEAQAAAEGAGGHTIVDAT